MIRRRTRIPATAVAASVAAMAAAAGPASAVERAEVIDTYVALARAAYEDSRTKAEALLAAVEGLAMDASPETLAAARAAWMEARVPYQQSEVFRFGNPVVDDWEGKVNAWPLDEGLIDYVDAAYGGATDENQYAALNVVANPSFELSGQEIDAAEISPELIADTLHEADEVETNVAAGYHAIEFLLWGQDLNGTEHGAGDRPWTDYAAGDACTGGNCDRRADYLIAATQLLVDDLDYMVAQWAEDGAAVTRLRGDEALAVSSMLTGMGSLSYGEQAGERMKLGVMLNDPEEEHDCFSDNTHNSHFYDGQGVRNVYLGEYVRVDGTVVEGASLSDLVAEADPEIDAALRRDLDHSMAMLGRIKTAAEAGFSYDQMLARGNAAGEALIMDASDALVAQTRSIERAVEVLGVADVGIAGSDSLDDPDAVFQ